MAFDYLTIQSPKRTSQTKEGWNGFFPYYAGFPESFSRALLESAKLRESSIILDPWNGSGTTTFSASRLGHRSVGFDLNPAMIIVAKARLLAPSEAGGLEIVARSVIKNVFSDCIPLQPYDPLLWWFEPSTAAMIRMLENRIQKRLIGSQTSVAETTRFNNVPALAAIFYVALFSICRKLAERFRSSNPTWTRMPKPNEALIAAPPEAILAAFSESIGCMANVLSMQVPEHLKKNATTLLQLTDTTSTLIPESSIDFILTSPPYCTRIDYSAATRIELAVLHPLMTGSLEELRRKMIGSTKVPDHEIVVKDSWGTMCARFLDELKVHPSKASAGYYYKTHCDYFEKMANSLKNLAGGLKSAGGAILVVQDSYYKNIHNNLPSIIAEMGEILGLQLGRRVEFELKNPMSGINPRTRAYRSEASAVEVVLCFRKS